MPAAASGPQRKYAAARTGATRFFPYVPQPPVHSVHNVNASCTYLRLYIRVIANVTLVKFVFRKHEQLPRFAVFPGPPWQRPCSLGGPHNGARSWPHCPALARSAFRNGRSEFPSVVRARRRLRTQPEKHVRRLIAAPGRPSNLAAPRAQAPSSLSASGKRATSWLRDDVPHCFVLFSHAGWISGWPASHCVRTLAGGDVEAGWLWCAVQGKLFAMVAECTISN